MVSSEKYNSYGGRGNRSLNPYSLPQLTGAVPVALFISADRFRVLFLLPHWFFFLRFLLSGIESTINSSYINISKYKSVGLHGNILKVLLLFWEGRITDQAQMERASESWI
jgi:hypothetical protein